jgi:hypothetical protein
MFPNIFLHLLKKASRPKCLGYPAPILRFIHGNPHFRRHHVMTIAFDKRSDCVSAMIPKASRRLHHHFPDQETGGKTRGEIAIWSGHACRRIGEESA